MNQVSLKVLMAFLLFNCLVFISLGFIRAQSCLKPLRGEILLSGNFGELRATHFHSGIDLKTGGVEGLPVVCVKDGTVSRVSVSPVGYGLALYIDHADGTTTVYGHLQRFEPQMAAVVRRLQYEQESFRIDEAQPAVRLHYRQGDTIGYSGNTGSSGGPHLHFEVRNTRTERTLNPLRFYPVRDGKAPLVKKLYLYTVAEDGHVGKRRSCALKNVAAGKYVAGRYTLPAGKVGVGLHVIDYMEGSWNKLGVYSLALVAGRDTLYSLAMDSCDFGESCFINDVKDFDCYKKKETVYRCFGNYQQRMLAVRMRGDGCVRLEQDSVVKVNILLSDVNGNRSTVVLELKGGEPAEVSPGDALNILRYDRPHVLEEDLGGWSWRRGRCCLLSSGWWRWRRIPFPVRKFWYLPEKIYLCLRRRNCR